MPDIRLSDRTSRQLGRFAHGTMARTAASLPGGFWLVTVQDDVIARINELRDGMKTDDQVIWRMMRAEFPCKEITK